MYYIIAEVKLKKSNFSNQIFITVLMNLIYLGNDWRKSANSQYIVLQSAI